jgi:putative ATP-binding cassette transporter
MVVGVLSYQLPMLRAQSIFRKAREDTELLMEGFRAMTYGAKELKIHSERRSAFLRDVLSETAASLSRHSIAGMKIHTIAMSWGQTIVFAVIGLIVFVLPSWIHISGQGLMAYTLSLLYIMSPLQVIMNQLPTLSRASVALRRVQELGFSMSSKEGDETCGSPAPVGHWQTLELVSVNHSYRGEDENHVFALGPISTTFHAGELVFITGGNGSGKTTLGKLLCGLYVPEKGQICLDGQPILSQAEKEYYRQHFAVVFSDCFVFDRMLGLCGVGLSELAAEYLRKLELAHKVCVKDGRLSTVELSQGQRKRLALLTAFLEDRQIYLFDEWAADQDPHFKAIFYLQLLPQLKAREKTVFVITHDDRYYGCADRLIKLDTGKIVSDTRSASQKGEDAVLTQASCRE